MTKNSNSDSEMAPAHSNPRSPQDEVMDFITTLGEHMEEVLSTASSHTEKGTGEPASANAGNSGAPDPPDYWEENKSEPGDNKSDAGGPSHPHHRRSHSHHRGGPPGDRREHRGGPPGGGWPNQWRQAAETWRSVGENMFNGGGPFGGPGGPWGGPPGHDFPFGGGRGGHCHRGFGHRGRGGHGGPDGPPQWGWKNRHHRRWNNDQQDQEFTPAVDLFDTTQNFTVHVALAGALKEDIGINYDYDNSELQISGIVHRPGDEEFLKTLVESERRVGAFDRKVKLESNGKTVAVDADGITAKLENGLLEVVVPKLRKSDEPEKKKISIS